MYDLWFVSLVGGIYLAFGAFVEANPDRTEERQWTEQCKDRCLKGCNYTRTNASLEVVCHKLKCKCIPDRIPRDVTRLVFTKNMLVTLKAGALQRLTELDELVLRSNRIRVFDQDAFKGLVKLRRLDLSNNIHAKFPKQLFEPLTNLQELRLSRTMKILKFWPNWLYNLTQLKTLSYDLNQLYRIPMFTSREGAPLTPKLKELHLEDNSIRQFYSRDLLGLSSLEQLFLCRNFIGFIEEESLKLLE